MTYNKRELLEMATPLFLQGEKRVWATIDGNLFYENAKGDCQSHNNYIKGESIIELLATDLNTEPIEVEPKAILETKQTNKQNGRIK